MQKFGDFAGIEKIELPYTVNDLTLEIVQDNLSAILSQHGRNAKKISYLLDYVDGAHQDIYDKTRKFETDESHNNKIIENHADALVSFKEGYLLGDKREFSQKSDVQTDDLIYLERYLCDSDFYSQDLIIKHNVYATGIATSFIQPRTDIIKKEKDNVSRYKTLDEGYDIDNDSPFLYEALDSRFNAVVYSDRVGQKEKDLFCFNISFIKENNSRKKIITVYTREWTAKFDACCKYIPGSYIETPSQYKELPMVEHSLNKSRIGIIEKVLDPLNAINLVVSNEADNIVDVVNQILVFLNCEIDEDTLREAYKKGAIAVPSTAFGQASVDKIAIDLKHSEINVFFEQLLTRCYDICGVPLASANVTSGGDTGQARLLGGGWTNAYTIIKRDIIAFESADRDVLRKMLLICKQNPLNKVDKLSINQIDIKYNVNMSDNLLVKTQSLQNLVDAGLPYEDILKAINLWSDTKTVAKRWRENVTAQSDQGQIDESKLVEHDGTARAVAPLNNTTISTSD